MYRTVGDYASSVDMDMRDPRARSGIKVARVFSNAAISRDPHLRSRSTV